MNRAAEVVEFYVLCNKLKDVVRTGWKVWHVKRERLESIAEHIYGVQMLAIAMWSEYNYEIDIQKVIMMLAVHELEEIKIGDLTPFEITKSEKAEIGHKAVDEVLAGMMKKEEIRELILEFDERKTAEAKFAMFCDKLEADLQCRIYDEEGDVDLSQQAGNSLVDDQRVKPYLDKASGWSEAWLDYNREKNGYDENFAEVSEYAKSHKILG